MPPTPTSTPTLAHVRATVYQIHNHIQFLVPISGDRREIDPALLVLAHHHGCMENPNHPGTLCYEAVPLSLEQWAECGADGLISSLKPNGERLPNGWCGFALFQNVTMVEESENDDPEIADPASMVAVAVETGHWAVLFQSDDGLTSEYVDSTDPDCRELLDQVPPVRELVNAVDRFAPMPREAT